ncbi:hypothetical protein MTO96_034827 [Rhipicephalus appendiculatus]
MMRNALPHLRHSKGTIVNVSSMASTVTVRNLTPYSITKAALDKLTRSAAFGVSVGENVTLSVRAAGMGTHADGHRNAMPEERLCYAHCAFRKTADGAGRCVEHR